MNQLFSLHLLWKVLFRSIDQLTFCAHTSNPDQDLCGRVLNMPTTAEKMDRLLAINKRLAINRNAARSRAEKREKHFENRFKELVSQVENHLDALREEFNALKKPQSRGLLEELNEHESVVFLGDDETMEFDGTDGLAFAPPGKEPYEDHDNLDQLLIVDCHPVQIRVEFTFDAAGRGHLEHKNFQAFKPLQNLEDAIATAGLNSSQIYVSDAISESKWVKRLTSRAECKLDNESVNYDPDCPTRWKGRGHLNDTITVLRLRDP